MNKKHAKTKYESPFARVFTSNSKKRDYWQPPILLIAHRDEPHNLEKDYYAEESLGASIVSRIAGVILSLFLMIGGVSTAFRPYALSRDMTGKEAPYSAGMDVASGLFCLILGAVIFWFCTRKLWKSLVVRMQNKKSLPTPNH